MEHPSNRKSVIDWLIEYGRDYFTKKCTPENCEPILILSISIGYIGTITETYLDVIEDYPNIFPVILKNLTGYSDKELSQFSMYFMKEVIPRIAAESPFSGYVVGYEDTPRSGMYFSEGDPGRSTYDEYVNYDYVERSYYLVPERELAILVKYQKMNKLPI